MLFRSEGVIKDIKKLAKKSDHVYLAGDPDREGVAGVYAAEAISDATAAICCTLLFFWQFPKILGKIQRSALRIS